MDFDNTTGNDAPSKVHKKTSFSGRGSLDAGSYDTPIRASGALSIHGDISAPSLKVSGRVKADGNVDLTEVMSASRSVTIDGGLKAQSVKCSGGISVGKGITTTESLKVSGKTSIGTGGLTAGMDVSVSGKLDVAEGDIQAKGSVKNSGKLMTGKGNLTAGEDIRMSGKFEINGDLTATRGIVIRKKSSGVIEGNVTGDVVGIGVGNDRGGDAQVAQVPGLRALSKLFKIVASEGSGLVEVKGSVTADEIFLQDAHIHGDVDGNSVVIGPNCTIDGQLRYRTSVEVDEGSQLAGEPVQADQPLALDSGEGPAK